MISPTIVPQPVASIDPQKAEGNQESVVAPTWGGPAPSDPRGAAGDHVRGWNGHSRPTFRLDEHRAYRQACGTCSPGI